jgi:hypothetical protein
MAKFQVTFYLNNLADYTYIFDLDNYDSQKKMFRDVKDLIKGLEKHGVLMLEYVNSKQRKGLKAKK